MAADLPPHPRTSRKPAYRPATTHAERQAGTPMWQDIDETKAVRSDGFVVRQVTPNRVVVTHQHGFTDRDWYTLWFGNPYTAFKPMPQGLLDCMALFGEGTVYEWKAYIDRASAKIAAPKKA